MTRCHVCERPCVYEVDPACGALPAVTVPDVWTVAMGNGLYVSACHSCWMKWPWDHRIYPATGFGRAEMRGPQKPPSISIDELVELLGPA